MKHDLPIVVDFHAHMLEKAVFQASTNKTVFTGFGANPMPAPRPGAAQLMHRMFDPKLEIEDMDARGIDVASITSSTVLQGTSWADPQTDLELVHALQRPRRRMGGAISAAASSAAACCRCRT